MFNVIVVALVYINEYSVCVYIVLIKVILDPSINRSFETFDDFNQ